MESKLPHMEPVDSSRWGALNKDKNLANNYLESRLRDST